MLRQQHRRLLYCQKFNQSKGAMPMQKNNTTITKKIGQTTYSIRIHFSKNSKEQLSDKLLRLVKTDFAKGNRKESVNC
jgi:hypothetical protein